VKWGRPFDRKAEAIWVRGTLVGRGGREQQLLLLVDPGTPETIVDDELATQTSALSRIRPVALARIGPLDQAA
jgi:hypothetical protein